MKGTPRYTQHSVAWKFSVDSTRPDIVDEINVSFDAKGGGTHGEFQFLFHVFDRGFGPNKKAHYCRALVFSDGRTAFLDNRVQHAWKRICRCKDQTPAKLIKFLEAEGIGPSQYHKDKGGKYEN